VSCKVAIANAEPVWLTQLLHGLQAMKGVTANAPTALRAQNSGEDVSDRIYVRRNVKSPPLVIVAGVDDNGEFLGRQNAAQSIHKLCAACAASENGDHAALRA
jgi:hypothetical protein